MAIRDLPSLRSLWSQNVRFAPQKQTSDDGVGMSAMGHKPTFFGDTPTLFFGDTPLYCRY